MKLLKWGLVCLLALGSVHSQAHETVQNGMVIHHAWMRQVVMEGMNAGGYFEIRNGNEQDDRLLAVKADFAKLAELHETREINGMMEMAPLDSGAVVPAGGVLMFKPGGMHVMLMGMQRKTTPGEHLPVTLVFEKAGEIQTDMVVQPLSGSELTHH